MKIYRVRKIIDILLLSVFAASTIGGLYATKAAAEKKEPTNMIEVYEGYLAEESGFISDDYHENIGTMFGDITKKELNEEYRDYQVLLSVERDEYSEVMAIPETEYCLYDTDIEDFGAVMVCSRKCGYWYVLEFVGMKENNGYNSYQVTYTEIITTAFEMKEGYILEVHDLPEIIDRMIDREDYITATHFTFLYQDIKEDIEKKLMYLHLTEEVEYPIIELLEGKTFTGVFNLSRGVTSIETLTLHAYPSEPLSLEIYYYTCCAEITEPELYGELKELLNRFINKNPEISHNYPYAYCYAVDSDHMILGECMITFETYYDESIYTGS